MVAYEKIVELMKEKGISSKELASTVGISEPMRSYVLRGLREPNVTTLVRISRVLGCTVDNLVKGT